MNIKGYSSEGIVLSKKNHGEADRILVVYSKQFGQLRLLAKGVRKMKSRKRGHLEVFTHVKFSASTYGNMDLITEVETINSFDEIRGDLKRVSLAYYLCEVLGKLTRDGEKNEKIFSKSIDFLLNIKKSVNLKNLRKKFVVETLESLGFWSDDDMSTDPDQMLEAVIERKINSVRVGRALLT